MSRQHPKVILSNPAGNPVSLQCFFLILILPLPVPFSVLGFENFDKVPNRHALTAVY